MFALNSCKETLAPQVWAPTPDTCEPPWCVSPHNEDGDRVAPV